ncbi:hypothetical protein NQ318_019868 [Aromia moschata]|uniref:DUF4817 domain-containing protein n=1 Tax=Aromia moschata TaxID=1265417 RepID=A0AAV8YKS6_9CUCU|nr:hypothetical protein NQ318_019868 [Aromia moschata]
MEYILYQRCGDKIRTHKQVCEIFNTKYPNRRIFQSTVSRTENKFREFGNVTDIPKSDRKRILDDEQKLDILLDIQDNPHKPTRQVVADNDVSKRSILRLLKKEKYRPIWFKNLTTMTLIADWNFAKSWQIDAINCKLRRS